MRYETERTRCRGSREERGREKMRGLKTELEDNAQGEEKRKMERKRGLVMNNLSASMRR